MYNISNMSNFRGNQRPTTKLKIDLELDILQNRGRKIRNKWFPMEYKFEKGIYNRSLLLTKQIFNISA